MEILAEAYIIQLEGYDKDRKVWIGKNTSGEGGHTATFRINVSTTTSADNKAAWDAKKQLELIKERSNGKKISWQEFHKQGYMFDKKDFKNFEATIYWSVTRAKWDDFGRGPDQMTFYGRGEYILTDLFLHHVLQYVIKDP